MRKTLSPYYVTIPLVSPETGLTSEKYRLEVYVWDGLKADVPIEATYSKTVVNSSSSTDSHNVNISRLINDFIDFEPQTNGATDLIDGNNQRWVKTQVFYQTSNISEADTPQSVELDIIVKGYTYGNEGVNQSTPANMNLISGTEFNVSRTGSFIVPIEIPETIPPPPEIVIISVVFGLGTTWVITFTTVGEYSSLSSKQDPTTGSVVVDTLAGVTSTQTIDVAFTGQDVDITMRGFDNSTGTGVVSNTITITT